MKIICSILVLLFSFSLNAKEEKNCDDLFNALQNIPQEINELKLYDYKADTIGSMYEYNIIDSEESTNSETIGIIQGVDEINEYGALIKDIALGSPIYFEGVKPGDYVQSINGIKISKEGLYNYSSKEGVDPLIKKTLFKKSFGIFPDYKVEKKGNIINKHFNEFTFKKTNKGYEVNLVLENSPAWREGIRPGSIITSSKIGNTNVLLDKDNLDRTLKEGNLLLEDFEVMFIQYLSGIRGDNVARDNTELRVINPGDDEEKKINLKSESLKLPIDYWHVAKHVYGYLLSEKINEIEIYKVEEEKTVTLTPKNEKVKYPINLDYAFYPDIVSIDTIENQFTINSRFWFRYFDRILGDYLSTLGFNKKIECKLTGEISTNYANFPNEINIQNVLEEKNKQISYNFIFYPEDRYETVESFNELAFSKKRSSNITIKKIMNLREFPFDSHEFKIKITNTDKINFRMEEFYRVYDNYWEDYNTNNELAEWKILNTSINLENFHDTDFYAPDPYFYRMSLNENYDNSEKKIFTIYAEREYNYYLIKIIIPIVLILIVCWSVFWINIVQIESRLTISVVCLLALIAYNVIVAESLPRIGYATVMDYIILSSYILGALSTILTVIFYNFHIRDYNVIRVEKFTRLALPILYLTIVYGIINHNIERLNTADIGRYFIGLLT